LHRHGKMQWSCRGRRTWHEHIRVPQEPGSPCRFHSASWRRGVARPENSRPRGRRRAAWERRRQTHWMVSPSDDKKRDETNGRASEHLIVPSKQGNGFRLDPGEGRGCRVTDLLGGNMTSASELDFVSTKQQQIAELAKQNPHMGFTSLAGSWKWTSAGSSTRWITLICGSCCGGGYATGCCCV